MTHQEQQQQRFEGAIRFIFEYSELANGRFNGF